jgi:FMN phosphatase YigB (HAD superfamily)
VGSNPTLSAFASPLRANVWLNKSMEKTYKVIFFDWHKTLSECDFWGQLKDPIHDRNHWHKNIINFLFVENDTLVQQWMRGKVSEEEILQNISEKFGYSIEILREDLAESCCAMTLLSEEILPFITSLREKGIRCVIATDNMDIFKKYVVLALRLDDYFDDILVSSEQGALKFDIAEGGQSIPFFHSYLKGKGWNYTDALLLDDRIDESGAYKQLGFDTFQVKNTNQFLEKMRKL